MENPFLQINKSNKILRVGILIVIGISITLMIMLSNTLSEVLSTQNSFLNFKSDKDKEIENLKKQLQEKEEEIKKLSHVKNVIKDHILSTNSGISEKVANKYAMAIIKESNERGHSPLIQTALLESESSFRTNPEHALTGVVGMGGIYWNVWKDKLRAEKIAYSKSDLKNPYTNIRASAYILSCYMDECKAIPRDALAHYKGYSTLGKNQANDVMKIALNLKRKANDVRES